MAQEPTPGAPPAGPPAGPPATPPPAPPATPPPAIPPPASVPGFLHQASPAVRDALLPHNFKTVDELGQRFLDLDKNVGADRVLLPKEDATEDDWQKFGQRIGVPGDAKDYGTFEFDGVKPDASMEAFAREIFPKAGVTKRGAPILVKGWNAMVAKVVADVRKAEADAEARGMEDLGRSWGARTSANLDIANRAATYFSLSAEEVGAMKKALGVEKAMTFLYGIGNAVATDGDGPDGGRPSFALETKEGAEKELDRMKKDPGLGSILRDPSHREHKDVKRKWDRLMDIVTR